MYAHKVYRGFESLSLRHDINMSYLVLARRWRPQRFEEVIGQEHVTRTLRNALASDRLAHAFLFTGTRGVGKTTVARLLAKAINCLGPIEEAPCNDCASCMEINEGRSVDVQEIDGASNNSVDQVRELRENARYRPASAKRKIYIIDEIHMLSKGAFNALLKTLEEPPEHVVFIFATTEAHKVPATILSRCQRYDFRPIPAGLIAAQLEQIIAREGFKIDAGATSLLARAAQGSLRDGLSLLDQTISFAGESITEKETQEILGLVDPHLVWRLAGAVLGRDSGAVLAGVEEVIQHGYDLRTFFQELMTHFRNLIVLRVDPQAGGETLGLGRAETEELLAQANAAGPETLQLCLQALLEAERLLRSTTQPRFAVEMALLKLCHLVPVVGLEEILSKLDRLKDQLAKAGDEPEPVSPALPRRSETPPEVLPADSSPPPPRVAPDLEASTLQPSPAESEEEEDLDAEANEGETARADRNPLVDWPQFVAWIKLRNTRLGAFLASTKARSLEGGTLQLELDSAFNFLADANRRREIEKLAGEFFGRPLRLSPVVNSTKANSRSQEADEARRLYQKAVEHPLVQTACELFEGQPVEVHPSPTGSKEE